MNYAQCTNQILTSLCIMHFIVAGVINTELTYENLSVQHTLFIRRRENIIKMVIFSTSAKTKAIYTPNQGPVKRKTDIHS